jgi:hypothetical protein
MKVVVGCINCNQIKRRSEAYHVKLQAKRNNASTIRDPEWVDVEERAWLCKACAVIAGYKVKTKWVLPKAEPINEKLLK